MKSKQSLESKLDAYKALSGEDGSAVKKGKRNWPIYAAAAGSSLAMTTSAEAGIIYSGVQNVTATIAHSWTGHSTNAGRTFDIGPAKFTVGVSQFVTGGAAFHNGVAELNGRFSFDVFNAGGLALKLASGAKISNGLGSHGTEGVLHHQSSTNARGNFVAGQTGFAGIKFGTGANEHFGWVRLEFQNSAGGYPKSITAVDWAYDTVAGESINAGQTTSAVPEPGSALLLLLGSGATGVLAWRKRRLGMKSQTVATATA